MPANCHDQHFENVLREPTSDAGPSVPRFSIVSVYTLALLP